MRVARVVGAFGSGVTSGVGVGLGVGVGDAVGVGVGVVGVAVTPSAVTHGLGLGDELGVGVFVGVPVGVGELVGPVPVGVGNGEAVVLGIGVLVRPGVRVGRAVTEEPGVGVRGVGDGVGELVGDGVTLGEPQVNGVAVTIGVGVGVGVAVAPEQLTVSLVSHGVKSICPDVSMMAEPVPGPSPLGPLGSPYQLFSASTGFVPAAWKIAVGGSARSFWLMCSWAAVSTPKKTMPKSLWLMQLFSTLAIVPKLIPPTKVMPEIVPPPVRMLFWISTWLPQV